MPPFYIWSLSLELAADTSTHVCLSAAFKRKRSIYMPINTRRTAQDLFHPVLDPEKMMRQNTAGPNTAKITGDVGVVCPIGRGEHTPGVISTTAHAQAATETARKGEKASTSRAYSQKETLCRLARNSSRGAGDIQPRYQQDSQEVG